MSVNTAVLIVILNQTALCNLQVKLDGENIDRQILFQTKGCPKSEEALTELVARDHYILLGWIMNSSTTGRGMAGL